ncbi:hypothetical protein PspR84_24610 [Pseudomonas sp. R84]|nr:hypothetical protein PspR84_24610 [Pseudomonas sp. R84]
MWSAGTLADLDNTEIPVGASLLAKRSAHSTLKLAGLALSRAGSLPHGVHGGWPALAWSRWTGFNSNSTADAL